MSLLAPGFLTQNLNKTDRGTSDEDEIGVGVGKGMGWWVGANGEGGLWRGKGARERFRLGIMFGEHAASPLHA